MSMIVRINQRLKKLELEHAAASDVLLDLHYDKEIMKLRQVPMVEPNVGHSAPALKQQQGSAMHTWRFQKQKVDAIVAEMNDLKRIRHDLQQKLAGR